MTIEQLSEKRKELRQQLIENGAMEGFKGLLTLLYSDKVHFIYELLQNAEDAKASEVKFFLNTDRLEFEHNGHELFTIEDVDSITNIGSSTKVDDVTNIGKFGIGFKAVFAYTSTPDIESGPFHFRIHDIFVPETEDLTPGSLGEKRTRFIFPFDNPEKPPEMAFADIKAKLYQLDANTLLFLSNICKIEYQFPDLTNGYLKRIESTNDKNRIEISTMRLGNLVPDSIHYLRFTKDVDVQDEDGRLKPCRIAIAFSMDKPEKGEWKIKPLNPGQVSIYFPAAKEPSNLLFHLHAPFASTVARDSVRDCPANDELRNHISELIAESMTTIHSRGLLDVEFLATLPNDKDQIRSFYQPILKRLVEEFNTNKLVPMKQGGHAAASETYRGSRRLSDLINDEDLATLLEKDSTSPLWIANPPQNNQREDNFLSMLDISEWTIEDLIEVLETHPDKVMGWLKEKTEEWHQQLYALLGDFLSSTPSSSRYFADDRKDRLSKLQIVRCSDDVYRTGAKSHFSDDNEKHREDLLLRSTVLAEKSQIPSQEEKHEEGFYYVAKSVYSAGQNKNQQKKARAFLEDIGVRKVDETERIKMILNHRYTEDLLNHVDEKQHIEDMQKFIAFFEKEPDETDLFKDYYIFETTGGRVSANYVFLDSPYLETGLSTCYEDDRYAEKLEDMTVDSPYFSLLYEESDIDLKKLGKFAEALGAKTKLKTVEQEIPPDHPEIKTVSGWKGYKTSFNTDRIIPEFEILLNNHSIEKSKLIWQTMRLLSSYCLEARYRYNKNHLPKFGSVSLVHELKSAEWVPQKNGDSITFVQPCYASIDDLPEGFLYETGQKWLETIEFGKVAKQRELQNAEIEEKRRLEIAQEENEKKVRNQRATEMGFNSADEAGTMAEIANVLKVQGKSPDELRNKLLAGKRRKERILIEIEDAPQKEYEQRLRSVKSTTGAIDRRTHLRVRYTMDHKMQCQMCHQWMPFKKRNSDEDYFEAVEGLGKDHFPKEHEAQHLALCPECAAKYKEFVKRNEAARKNLYNLLRDSDVPEVSLQASGETIRIWFEEKHWNDLKTVLHYYENVYDSEDSTD